MQPKKVTQAEANQIIETRKPLGKFYLVHRGKYYGIKNSFGNPREREFTSGLKMLEWLEGGEVREG